MYAYMNQFVYEGLSFTRYLTGANPSKARSLQVHVAKRYGNTKRIVNSRCIVFPRDPEDPYLWSPLLGLLEQGAKLPEGVRLPNRISIPRIYTCTCGDKKCPKKDVSY